MPPLIQIPKPDPRIPYRSECAIEIRPGRFPLLSPIRAEPRLDKRGLSIIDNPSSPNPLWAVHAGTADRPELT